LFELTEEKEYIKKAMSNAQIQRQVIKYLKKQTAPVKVSSMVSELRSGKLLESEVRSVVQPMIVTGQLSYTPGLKIKLGNLAK
jgi:hypothetical protein